MGFNIKNINKRSPEWLWKVSKLPLLKCIECGGELYDSLKLSGLLLERQIKKKTALTCDKGSWKCINDGCGQFDKAIPDYALEGQITDKDRIPLHVLQNFDKEFNILIENGDITVKTITKEIPREEIQV